MDSRTEVLGWPRFTVVARSRDGGVVLEAHGDGWAQMVATGLHLRFRLLMLSVVDDARLPSTGGLRFSESTLGILQLRNTTTATARTNENQNVREAVGQKWCPTCGPGLLTEVLSPFVCPIPSLMILSFGVKVDTFTGDHPSRECSHLRKLNFRVLKLSIIITSKVHP